MTEFLDRATILGHSDLPREEVPFLGGKILMRGLTVNERDEYDKSCMITDVRSGRQSVNIVGMRAKLVTRCAIKQDGSRLFEEIDALKIGSLPAKDVERAFEAAQRLSGISDRDLEELEKNSGSGQPNSSSTI